MSPIPPTYTNEPARDYACTPLSPSIVSSILNFHRTLPQYSETPLIPLPNIAKRLGLQHLLLKHEGTRFGLPSFKILGASYAIAKAIAEHTGTVSTAEQPLDLSRLAKAAQVACVKLVTCSDGNWGRAVSRMASYLGIPATVYVPIDIDEPTRAKIAGEGADCRVTQGEYDDSIAEARAESERVDGALLVMDTSWEGYHKIPGWVAEGYVSMLEEVETQLEEFTNGHITHAVCSVGVGSWAQAVVSYYKSRNTQQPQKQAQVITVEAENAPSLLTSLSANPQKITPIKTKSTIMCGMNCGTTSTNAWPYLRDGVSVATAISDQDSHQALEELRAEGVEAGPCGAAPLAALKQLLKEDRGEDLGLRDGIVVLFCTEGYRDYVVPTLNGNH